MNYPQPQALEASRYRPIVSAVLIVLLFLLIVAARSHRGEDQGLSAYSAAVSQTSAVTLVTTGQLSHGG